MSEKMKMDIRLFGAFRNYWKDETITVEVREGATARDVRSALEDFLMNNVETFAERALVSESMLATEDTVLELGDVVPAGRSLAILPPVCGG